MKKGQILLITVMLLATLMTVVLSVSFQSVTETQLTKLEEENQKALAAAEAALEAALKQGAGTVYIGEGALSSLTGFTGSASVETTTSNQFTSSLVPKDDSYTFYLENYDPVAQSFSGNSSAEDITLCFQSGTTNPALEITLVKDDAVVKKVVDPDSRISNASSGSTACTPNSNFNYSYSVSGTDISTNTKLMEVRILYSSTKLFIKRSSDLPLQGKTVVSEASSPTGVSKKITLFQSYPQIPAEFFSTSF